MRAIQIIQRQFRPDLERVHLARFRLVFAAVFTALRCGRISLTALGRAISETTSQKHGIKRIDRLLGNVRLYEERIAFYQAIARRLVSASSRPLVIVDWTAITPNLWALVAAVSFQGRALTIYAESHPISRYLKPYVNAAFLKRVRAVLPRDCRPIILADAGFRSPFMKLVERMGWDYVIRLRGPAKLRHKYGRGWTALFELFERAGTRPKDFGHVEIGQRVRYRTRLIGVRRPIRHRKYHSRQRHSTVSLRERAQAHEPWILATSLTVESTRVVALYARRMQIEETFRDTKNPRFGMCLGHARPRFEHRADVLLLLASLAHLLALLLGIGAEAAHLERGFQANTIVRRRVLSLVTLGRLLVTSGNEAVVAAALGDAAWPAFRARVADGLAF
jgi:hypothetical protein